jgi:PAS domain S-box-containing protein
MKDPGTGDLTGVVEFARDITDQREASRKLAESEQKYRQLFGSLHNPVLMYDVETMEIRDANAAVTEQFGYPYDTILKLKITDFSAEPDKTLRAVQDTVLGDVYDVPFRYLKRRDGRVFPAQIMRGMMTLDGRRYCIAVIHDLSQRIILEKALKDQADKLAQYSRDLTQANRKLNLVGEVTRHSIANKLTVISGSLDVLKGGGAAGDVSRYLSEMERATDSISRTIAFEKEFGQIGTKNPEWLNLRDTISRAAGEFRFDRVRLDVDTRPLEIFADPLLEKAFQNLIDNAFRHGGAISRISVACEKTYGGIIIRFEDDGCGIPYPDKERIFERGFGKNTGFGLFLIREILGITDITIRECGTPRNGARFELFVPEGAFRAAA